VRDVHITSRAKKYTITTKTSGHKTKMRSRQWNWCFQNVLKSRQ